MGDTLSFKPEVLSERAVRAHLEEFLGSIEKQRLVAWAKWQCDPEDTEATKLYRKLCQEQRSLKTAVDGWLAEHPDNETDL